MTLSRRWSIPSRPTLEDFARISGRYRTRAPPICEERSADHRQSARESQSLVAFSFPMQNAECFSQIFQVLLMSFSGFHNTKNVPTEYLFDVFSGISPL